MGVVLRRKTPEELRLDEFNAAQKIRYKLSSSGSSTPGLFSLLKPSRGGASPETTPTRITRR